MSKPVKISTVLTRAAKYIEENGWVQRSYFKYRNGHPVERKDGEAWADTVARAKDKGCRACALGAIYVGAEGDGSLYNRAAEVTDEVVGGWPSGWNDMPERTKDEVVAALKEAAKAARKDGK